MMGLQTIRCPSSRNDELLRNAEVDALRAINLDSLDSLAHFSLSYIRWAQKRIEAALAACDNSLALDGNNVRAGLDLISPDGIESTVAGSPPTTAM